MSLDMDTRLYLDRLRRRLTLWRVLAVAAVVGLVLSQIPFPEEAEETKDHVARLTVEGIIFDDSYRTQRIRDLAEDDSVKAVILRIDSPGGTVVGGEGLYEALRILGEDKPLVAVMGQVAASGGYMTALAAERLFARGGTITGSIGVILQATDMTGLLDKLGIKPEAVKSGPLKMQPNPFEEFTPEARAASREMVMDMYDMFVAMVADRRDLARQDALRLADGRVYTGRQAAQNGLVDALGGEEEALEWLQESRDIDPGLPVRDVDLEAPKEGWRRLVEAVAGKTVLTEGFTRRLSLDGLLALWQPFL